MILAEHALEEGHCYSPLHAHRPLQPILDRVDRIPIPRCHRPQKIGHCLQMAIHASVNLNAPLCPQVKQGNGVIP